MIKTFSEINNVCRYTFAEYITKPEEVETAWPNIAFKTEDPTKLRIRVTIHESDSKNADVGCPGRRRVRVRGILVAEVMGPKDVGDGAILLLCDKVVLAFENKSFSGVRFQVPELVKVGVVDSAYQINVNCPFYSDLIKTA